MLNNQKLDQLQLAFQTYESMKSLVSLNLFKEMPEELSLLKDYVEILQIKSGSTYSEVKQLVDDDQIKMPDNECFVYNDATTIVKNLNRTYRYLYFTMLCTVVEHMLCFEKARIRKVQSLADYAYSQFIRSVRNANGHVEHRLEFNGPLKERCDDWVQQFINLEVDGLVLEKISDGKSILYSYCFSPLAYKSIVIGLQGELRALVESRSPLVRGSS